MVANAIILNIDLGSMATRVLLASNFFVQPPMFFLTFPIMVVKFVRKPTFMISNLLMATGGMLAAFAPEFFTFVACRVLAGFAIAGVEVI